jgi:hypothetical protein
MVFDPGRPVASDGEAGTDPQPPHMLRRPADPPPPMGRLAQSAAMRAFWTEDAARREPPGRGSLRARARRWAGRISGRADRRLLVALADAVNVLTERCDSIADRLESQEALASDITESFGSELAHLRAEVGHLRALAASLENPGGG